MAEERRERVATGSGRRLIRWIFVALVLGVLATFAVPRHHPITDKARAAKQLSNTKQVILALRVYAIDYDGQFPQIGGNYEMHPNGSGRKKGVVGPSADSVFDALVPEYMSSEQMFHHWTSGDPRPDENGFLTAGENHFSYVYGLDEESPGTAPLVFQAPGTADSEMRWHRLYTWRFGSQQRQRGAAFGKSKGKMRIPVGRIDGSASLVPISRDGTVGQGESDFLADIPADVETQILHPGWLR